MTTDTNEAQKALAKQLCFSDCSQGKHLDYEAGCCSVCKSPDECQGWVPYLRATDTNEVRRYRVSMTIDDGEVGELPYRKEVWMVLHSDYVKMVQARAEPVAWLQRHRMGPLHLSHKYDRGNDDWSAAFPVYGRPPADAAEIDRLKAKVYDLRQQVQSSEIPREEIEEQARKAEARVAELEACQRDGFGRPINPAQAQTALTTLPDAELDALLGKPIDDRDNACELCADATATRLSNGDLCCDDCYTRRIERALETALRARLAGVTVKPGEIERAVWSAMIWAASGNAVFDFDRVPEYKDGNSFAEDEVRRAAARILAALTPNTAQEEG